MFFFCFFFAVEKCSYKAKFTVSCSNEHLLLNTIASTTFGYIPEIEINRMNTVAEKEKKIPKIN